MCMPRTGSATQPRLVRAAGDATLIRDLDPKARDLEGYLFPETYTLSRSTSASDLVAMMVAGFRRNMPDASSRAAEQGFTVRELVALASLVEKETGRADERPLVAAVYRNRLKIKMGMQADPTVVYALQKAGRYDGNIRRADLEHRLALQHLPLPRAAARSDRRAGEGGARSRPRARRCRVLYFVSRNDGSHVFAETLAQHNANVYEYQVAYFKRQKK